MSIGAIQDFFKDLDKNEEISKELDAIQPSDNYKEAIVELANKHGYEFTLEELLDVVETAKKIQEGEAAK